MSISPLEPFDYDSSEATVELQEVEVRPPRPRRERRTARRDAGRGLARLGALARRRAIPLRHDVPPAQRWARGLAAAALLAVFAFLASTGGGEEPSKAVQPPAAGAAEGPAAGTPTLQLPAGRVLKVGERGPLVRELQRALTLLGFSPGKPDGIYGRATREAVALFQASQGLDSDGAFGAGTARALNKALTDLP